MTTRVSGPVQPPLDKEDRLCVLQAADGRSGDRLYFSTGRIVSAHTTAALRRQFHSVRLLDSGDVQKAAAACAKERGKYLITIRLVRWDDYATAWSIARDQVEIALALDDLSGHELRAVAFEARQGGGLHLGDSPAEELLGDAYDAAVLRLVGENPSR